MQDRIKRSQVCPELLSWSQVFERAWEFMVSFTCRLDRMQGYRYFPPAVHLTGTYLQLCWKVRRKSAVRYAKQDGTFIHPLERLRIVFPLDGSTIFCFHEQKEGRQWRLMSKQEVKSGAAGTGVSFRFAPAFFEE